MTSKSESSSVRMEINGHPYYIKSKDNVPYLYDVYTNDEVGYWSSKKGQYIMFSLYNKLMKKKYEYVSDSSESESVDSKKTQHDSSSESEHEDKEEEELGSESEHEDKEDEELGSESEHEDEEEEESGSEPETQITSEKTKNKTNKSSLGFLFLVLFVYLILQKEFQSIHFDFIFLISFNLLHAMNVFEML
jgi:hypothetical protein